MSRRDRQPIPDGTTPTGARVVSGDEPSPPLPLWYRLSSLRQAMEAAGGLVLGLDFDGTLAPIAADPDAPTIHGDSRAVLARLATRDDVHLAVVSGRALSDVRSRVDVAGPTYAGNHGLELFIDGRRVVHPLAKRRREDVTAVADAVADALADVDGCFVETKGLTATVHHRQAPADRTPAVRATVDRVVDRLAGGRLHSSTGKQVVEVGPTLGWDKGSAMRVVHDRFPPDWLACYVGDDDTDEDAFRALATRGGIGIHVGDGPTDASFTLADPDDVARFLRWLDACGCRHASGADGSQSTTGGPPGRIDDPPSANCGPPSVGPFHTER